MIEGRKYHAYFSVRFMAIAFALAVMFAACSDTPTESNSVGDSLLSKNLVVRDTTLQSVASTSFRKYTPMDSRVNLVGHHGNYSAYTALQFFSSGFPNRDTIQVVSATLKLRLVSWFGDSTGTFAFDVHKVTQSWAQQTLQWDSIQTGFYESSVVRGSYSGGIVADTEFISVSLDTSMVREWLQPATVTSYGIILVPTTSCSIVRGINEFDYDSTQYYPTLLVIARNNAGTVQDTATYASGGDTFAGNIDDLSSNPSLLYLQAGVVYRSTIKFDVSGIARGSLIQSAELLLVRDPATTILTKFSGDPAISAHVLMGTDSSNFEASSTTGQQVSGTDTFSVDLRHAVQLWIKGPNYGLLLRTTSLKEFESFDLYTFHTQAAASPAVRPRLKIRYVFPTL
jgi:hypothetical protein